MKSPLNLPWGLYASLLFFLLVLTFIWDKVESQDYKTILKYLGALFFFATLRGALAIRFGTFEKKKNTLNAIWNIETAGAFFYATYLLLEYSIYGLKQPEIISKWAMENNLFFIFIVCALGTVAIIRAAYSLAEIFKDSILSR
ncbi:hypothetical protein [Citrobacter europaeus]|uniref:hypothetical protein n=1 Tax=Citrobacter europaeus TaxID=1914243 RepID=UPI001C7E607B|nr:hypothetical protein [Citrobacter europaeus]GIZ19867.1 hypothetical protein TUM12147_32030 [Citrobacter europaeus]GIZ25722.1 hypothetical protein TUM12148_43860 [Citrobacter europaeus]